jgi:excisionase family DNA binding protein
MPEFPPKPFALPRDQRSHAAEAADAVGTYLARVPKVSVVKLTPSLNEVPSLELSTEVLSILQQVLEELGEGNAVTVSPYPSELSTQQAAEILNVSRPYVVKLMEQGDLPFRKVGPRRRTLLNDIVAYKDRDDQARRAAADELSREAQRLGLGYTDDASATSSAAS